MLTSKPGIDIQAGSLRFFRDRERQRIKKHTVTNRSSETIEEEAFSVHPFIIPNPCILFRMQSVEKGAGDKIGGPYWQSHIKTRGNGVGRSEERTHGWRID
jgi:hypothetical protein